MPVLAWLARIISSPIVANILVPSLSNALAKFFESQATRVETSTAVAQAKAASKIADGARRAEELRNASKKLSDAGSR